MPLDRIPVIDFAPFLAGSDADKRQVAKAIREACEQVGFLYLANHGVPQAKIDAVFAAARRFFALPEARKMDPALRVTPQRTRGYQPLFARLRQGEEPPRRGEHRVDLRLRHAMVG
ncbi:MAG TPA: 2-oxoglutarate and iron-dependent oxygenase domain-containing protein, partial [Alphaproteobacteria bacterium]|nr:2-oxoglutarate and iron-dependent oxygenase domain-containing protein [Alphaproteobacteria bacterium]